MQDTDMPNLTSVRGFGNIARYVFLFAALAFAIILAAHHQPWLEFAQMKVKIIEYFMRKPQF